MTPIPSPASSSRSDLGEAHHRELARLVRAESHRRRQHARRRGEHDPPEAAPRHAASAGTRAPSAPCRARSRSRTHCQSSLGELVDRAELLHADVRAEDVAPAQRRLDVLGAAAATEAVSPTSTRADVVVHAHLVTRSPWRVAAAPSASMSRAATPRRLGEAPGQRGAEAGPAPVTTATLPARSTVTSHRSTAATPASGPF